MTNSNTAVAVLIPHTTTKAVRCDRQKRGLNMRSLSLMIKGRRSDGHVVDCSNAGDRLNRWGPHGVFWQSLCGTLFGSAFFMVPGFGPVLVAGPLVSVVVTAMEGAALLSGISSLGGILVSFGAEALLRVLNR